jgi:anti-sigma B factor antagonist
MLEITPRLVDQVLVLDGNGRMAHGEDLAFFKNFLKELLLTTNALVMNLKHVGYMDSSGLSVLVSTYTSARQRGATIKLANVNPGIHDLLRVTKLFDVLEIYDAVDEAVAGFRKAASAYREGPDDPLTALRC